MRLTELLKPWNLSTQECIIQGINNDSRLVKTGDLFIAYAGAAVDGRLFIEQAIHAGAAAVLYDPSALPAGCTLSNQVPCIAVPQLAQHLAAIASQFYNHPSASLTLTGITGTNGKTTIAYQLAQAHVLLGQQSAYIGTIGQGDVNHLQPLANTTPDALCLQKLLHHYLEEGRTQVCMEVSSHALSQHRVDAIEFRQAIFTNLTLDHLDYHKTMDAYGAAKALLFAKESLQWAIINQDDPYQKVISKAVPSHVKKITYGMHQHSDVQALDWEIGLNGTEIEIRSPWGRHLITIQALGGFNIYNSLAIFSSLLASGYTAAEVVQVMQELKAAPGRMEIVATSPFVLVDYAHTPDALENVLLTLKELKKGNLWVIFGCGGDRDQSKRPIMGRIAHLHADKIIITSDNPRTEVPELIIEAIAAGIKDTTQVTQIVNREEAIKYALQHAAKEDIILIAGKGHETYQQIGTVQYPFSDKKVVHAYRSQDKNTSS